MVNTTHKPQAISDVEARLSGTFDRFELSLLSGEVEASAGTLTVGSPDAGLTTAYSDLVAEIDYSADDQIVMIHNLSANLPDGQAISFAGRLTHVHSAQIGYSGTMLGEDIALPRLLQVWPDQQATTFVLLSIRIWQVGGLRPWRSNLKICSCSSRTY